MTRHVWVVMARTTDAYEWSEWSLEAWLTEADALARKGELDGEFAAARDAWPEFPEDPEDEVLWAEYERGKAAALALIPTYPGGASDAELSFWIDCVPLRETPTPADASAQAPHTSAASPSPGTNQNHFKDLP